MNTYDAIAGAVNRRRPVRPSRQDIALQAFVGAVLLRERQLGIDNLSTAARLVGVSRSSVSAAVALLKHEDANLVARVLSGRESLRRAADEVRFCALMARAHLARFANVESKPDFVNAPLN